MPLVPSFPCGLPRLGQSFIGRTLGDVACTAVFVVLVFMCYPVSMYAGARL
jgi:hypothetical protein